MFNIWIIYRYYFVDMLKLYINWLNNIQQPKTIYTLPNIPNSSGRKRSQDKKTGEVKRMVVYEKMRELVDELRFWGDIILSHLSYPEDEPLYSSIEYACMHPNEISMDSVELTVIANSQIEDGEMENMLEEFYELLIKIAEENE